MNFCESVKMNRAGGNGAKGTKGSKGMKNGKNDGFCVK